MKQYFIKHLLSMFSIAVFTSQSIAQSFAYTVPPAVAVASAKTEMNEKVSTAFNSNFKGASNITWYKMGGNTMTRFTMNNILHRVLFSKKGVQIYHISYPEAGDLSNEMTRLLNNRFKGYSILRGIHVLQDDLNVWLMTLEGEKNLIIVRIEDEETALVNTSIKTD